MSELKVRTMADFAAKGETPEILFWVGCSGSFDDRAKRVTKAIAKILNHCEISFAILGNEEACTGDPAKRAGNEFLFQMLASQNIQTLDGYGIKKIVTGCPHCFNIIKNEYPTLGGHYDIIHHTQLINQLLADGKIVVKDGKAFKGKRITFHDPCYLGRGNNVYEAPREALMKLDAELVEMKHNRSKAFCCGAGGAQMFKESEKGKKEINVERVEQAEEVKPDIIASGCPFCKSMLSDGVKLREKESTMTVRDIAELIAEAADL